MKTFEQLKAGDKLYLYNKLIGSMLITRVQSVEPLKSRMFKVVYANDALDEDCIVLTNAGKTKSRVNLNENIIYSTEPIQ